MKQNAFKQPERVSNIIKSQQINQQFEYCKIKWYKMHKMMKTYNR